MPHFLFSTPLGTCGVAWNERGLTGLQLPEASPAATERRLASRCASEGRTSAPPAYVKEAVAWISDLMAGRSPAAFRGKLDWEQVSEFRARVYRAAMQIPAGHTCSYGELAQRLGLKPGASRAVGQALGANPWPLLVPCHRIVAANGKLTGFSAHGGIETKARLLSLEGAELSSAPI